VTIREPSCLRLSPLRPTTCWFGSISPHHDERMHAPQALALRAMRAFPPRGHALQSSNGVSSAVPVANIPAPLVPSRPGSVSAMRFSSLMRDVSSPAMALAPPHPRRAVSPISCLRLRFDPCLDPQGRYAGVPGRPAADVYCAQCVLACLCSEATSDRLLQGLGNGSVLGLHTTGPACSWSSEVGLSGKGKHR
jgi:hypothetical protein